MAGLVPGALYYNTETGLVNEQKYDPNGQGYTTPVVQNDPNWGGEQVLGDSTPAPDPYAGTPFGSTAGYNKANADYQSLKGNTLGSINQGIDQAGQGYHSSILDYLDQRKSQQKQIDTSAVQNELSRQQGSQSILDMVGNGVKSGGVMLANRNAGSSSANEALARAYGTVGREQMSKVGNQFAQGQAGIQANQENLGIQDATQFRHSNETKNNVINSIVNDATSKLSSLNQQAATASLPDRINIEQQIAQIKAQALQALSQYDAELSNLPAAATPDQTRADATNLRTAGVAPENQFDYTSQIPGQFQDTGQFASSLPIFTRNRRETT